MKSMGLKILIIILCIFFVIIFFTDIMVASDIEHLQYCAEENCEKCILIYNADNTLKTIVLFILSILSGNLTFLIINKIKEKSRDFMSLTLVNCKVRFNE